MDTFVAGGGGPLLAANANAFGGLSNTDNRRDLIRAAALGTLGGGNDAINDDSS